MLPVKLDNFSCCKATNTRCMDLIFRTNFFANTTVLFIIDVVEIATFETETSLKFRDQDFIKSSETRDLKFENEAETRDFKICGFSKYFPKNVVTISSLNFFESLAFFLPVLVVSYLQIQQRKTIELQKMY